MSNPVVKLKLISHWWHKVASNLEAAEILRFYWTQLRITTTQLQCVGGAHWTNTMRPFWMKNNRRIVNLHFCSWTVLFLLWLLALFVLLLCPLLNVSVFWGRNCVCVCVSVFFHCSTLWANMTVIESEQLRTDKASARTSKTVDRKKSNWLRFPRTTTAMNLRRN